LRLARAAAVAVFILVQSALAQTKRGAPPSAPADAVFKPNSAGITAGAIGTVNVDQMWIHGRLQTVMQLGSAPQNQPGITFTAGGLREPPGFTGIFSWFQTCVPNRWLEDNNGHWTHLVSDGPCRDLKAPYDSDDSGDTNDTPAMILDSHHQAAAVYDQYTTTLMYQPSLPNSIWVPVVSFSWYWTGISTRKGSTWALTNAGTSGNPRPNTNPGFPTWTAPLSALLSRSIEAPDGEIQPEAAPAADIAVSVSFPGDLKNTSPGEIPLKVTITNNGTGKVCYLCSGEYLGVDLFGIPDDGMKKLLNPETDFFSEAQVEIDPGHSHAEQVTIPANMLQSFERMSVRVTLRDLTRGKFVTAWSAPFSHHGSAHPGNLLN
jgi:hypothetical protein